MIKKPEGNVIHENQAFEHLKVGDKVRIRYAKSFICGHTPIWADGHTGWIKRLNPTTVSVELSDEQGKVIRVDYSDLELLE